MFCFVFLMCKNTFFIVHKFYCKNLGTDLLLTSIFPALRFTMQKRSDGINRAKGKTLVIKRREKSTMTVMMTTTLTTS